MTRAKRKRRAEVPPAEDSAAAGGSGRREVPIDDLPDRFLWMRVRSGTKMRNVLQYATENFSQHDSIVWTAIGRGIGKGISCAELFKRKHGDLHQVTKLRYVESDKNPDESEDSKKSRVPEIHILLTRNPRHTNEPGYQKPGDAGEHLEAENGDSLEKQRELGNFSGRITSLAAEEFAAMGLRTGQKRSRREQAAETPSKKNKKKGGGT